MSALFYVSYAVLWILVAFQSLVLLGLVRTVYRLQGSGAVLNPSVVDGNGALRGREAPDFTSSDVFGSLVVSQDFENRLRALLFVSPDCPACSLTLSEMEALQMKAEGSVLVVCRADRDDCRQLAEAYELSGPVLVDEDHEVSQLFGISSVPAAVLINERNRIQSYGQPMRGGELDELLREAATSEMQIGG